MLLASSLPTLSSWEVLLRVGLAAALGGVLGLERELREREAGLRTHLAAADRRFSNRRALPRRNETAAGRASNRAEPSAGDRGGGAERRPDRSDGDQPGSGSPERRADTRAAAGRGRPRADHPRGGRGARA